MRSLMRPEGPRSQTPESQVPTGRVHFAEAPELLLASAIALLLLAVVLATSGCGGSAKNWTALDTQDATDLANAALALEEQCSRDGGPCQPGAVRSVEIGEYCNSSSMLYRHLMPIPTGVTGEIIKCSRLDGGASAP